MERTRRPQAATPAWNKLELVSQRRPAMHTIPVHGSSIGLVGVPHGLMPHMAEPAKLEEEIKTNEVLAKIFENRGDYEESVRLAKQHSGKIATMREVIKLAKSNPELLGMLEGEKIYVSDVPAKASGHYRINYRSGRLEAVNEAEWHKLPFKERALVRQGDHHTLVDFRSRRFFNDKLLYIDNSKHEHEATVVVIIKRTKQPRRRQTGGSVVPLRPVEELSPALRGLVEAGSDNN